MIVENVTIPWSFARKYQFLRVNFNIYTLHTFSMFNFEFLSNCGAVSMSTGKNPNKKTCFAYFIFY